MGLDAGTYLDTFQRLNVLNHFPGRSGPRDDRFPLREAKLAARSMLPLLQGRDVILVGRNVAQVFDQPAGSISIGLYHTEQPHNPRWRIRRLFVVPHPSGRNHWYNRVINREEARRFWSQFLMEYSVERNMLSSADTSPILLSEASPGAR
jgi:hypothetical protein